MSIEGNETNFKTRAASPKWSIMYHGAEMYSDSHSYAWTHAAQKHLSVSKYMQN